MADLEQMSLVKNSVKAWNTWRRANEGAKLDLRAANLAKLDLRGIDLSGVDLYRATLWRADLSGANLTDSDCSSTTLNGATLCDAMLLRTNLRFSRIVGADLTGAHVLEAYVYGASIWNLRGQPKKQQDLIITPPSEPRVTVDNLEVAQFIYLLLRNERIRGVLNTITTKAVLILGSFSEERKRVLDAVRECLRRLDLLPIIFDFQPPQQTILETVRALAHLSRFVIADITDAKGVMAELCAIVPDRPTLPVHAIISAEQEEAGMFDFLHQYPWFLGPYRYSNQTSLLGALQRDVVMPAVIRANELQAKARQVPLL